MNDPTDLHQKVYGKGLSRRTKPARLWLRWHMRGVMGKPRRILVGLRWRLGDEIMALPVYGVLKRTWPDSRIAVWCNFPDILLDHPHVDEINPKGYEFDRFINLRGAPRNRYRILHYARQAGVAPPKSRPHLFYRDWSTPLLQPATVAKRPIVALCPGASWPSKRWGLADWQALARGLASAGFTVVELGVPDDPLINVGISLRGLTTVREAACILQAAKLAITADSGLMHLALAADTPTIGLFGPTVSEILIRDEPRLTVLTNGRPCQGCWNRFRMTDIGMCPLGVPECLSTIRPETVLDTAKEVLDHAG